MFKLPDGIPSLRNSSQDWADFAEFHAINLKSISLIDLIKRPLMVSDEIEINGIDDDTDRLMNKVDDISAEIRYRIKISKGKYPFELANSDYSLIYNPKNDQDDIVYKFLLMTTRIRMTGANRILEGRDGALLFEHLSAVAALSFFGENSGMDILGTSKTQRGGFREKLNEVVKKIGEGGLIHQNQGHRPQDENVDIIIWKGFTDQQPSKLIAFGQCKTGTSWVDKLSELNTESFCKTWFSIQPVLTPIRMFFCAQYFPRDIWRVRAYEAGLVFDRFRIIEYLPDSITEELLLDIYFWINDALAKFNLPEN